VGWRGERRHLQRGCEALVLAERLRREERGAAERREQGAAEAPRCADAWRGELRTKGGGGGVGASAPRGARRGGECGAEWGGGGTVRSAAAARAARAAGRSAPRRASGGPALKERRARQRCWGSAWIERAESEGRRSPSAARRMRCAALRSSRPTGGTFKPLK